MDLPKNITQIGEADAACKIYVEDYVVSYLKQLNPLARDKTMAAALYGKKKTEENKIFLFVYGAGKLDFIQRETKHLSQAQMQEIERIRRQYFQDYEFLGYRILNGEMVEGFHVYEQETCRYVTGYAQFYEKNEAMLSYMLESRQAEVAPEAVNYEKYDAARGRQEKRRAKYVRHGEEREGELVCDVARKGGLRAAVVTLFVLLCALGLVMNSSALEEQGISLDKLKKQFSEIKPEEPEEIADQGNEMNEPEEEILQVSGKVAEEQCGSLTVSGKPMVRDKQEEETRTQEKEQEAGAKMQGKEQEAGAKRQGKEQEAEAKTQGKEQEAEAKTQGKEAEEQSIKQTRDREVYIVRAGDTLTGISIRNYGSEKYIEQICQLNSIKNPDEIKIGQKILLP